MRFLVASSILLVLLTTVFALQNSQPVSVNFLKWILKAPLVIILLITFFAGALAAFLISIPWRIRISRELSRLRKTQEGHDRNEIADTDSNHGQ